MQSSLIPVSDVLGSSIAENLTKYPKTLFNKITLSRDLPDFLWSGMDKDGYSLIFVNGNKASVFENRKQAELRHAPHNDMTQVYPVWIKFPTETFYGFNVLQMLGHACIKYFPEEGRNPDTIMSEMTIVGNIRYFIFSKYFGRINPLFAIAWTRFEELMEMSDTAFATDYFVPPYTLTYDNIVTRRQVANKPQDVIIFVRDDRGLLYKTYIEGAISLEMGTQPFNVGF